jgi:electron transfer flavoprotein alpha subunit
MAGIWIFAEDSKQTLELLNAGQGLAKELGVKLVTFAFDGQQAEEYINHGSDEILLLPPLAQDQPLEAYIPVIAEAAQQEGPDVFLVGGTLRGKEIAARVAARLNAGMCSGCTGFKLDGEKKLLMERMVYGGAGVQTVVCSSGLQMAAVQPRAFEPADPCPGKQGNVRELPVPPPSALKVIKRTPKAQESVDLTEAKIIIGVGRGVEKKEDISLAEELAQVLGGEVGCSRPVAEELGWMPEERYMGISGKKVKPDLYIGVGVAGQIQHVSGIRDSKIIVGINRDENAPIFEAADYGIVGDLYDVVPKLIKEFKLALNK